MRRGLSRERTPTAVGERVGGWLDENERVRWWGVEWGSAVGEKVEVRGWTLCGRRTRRGLPEDRGGGKARWLAAAEVVGEVRQL